MFYDFDSKEVIFTVNYWDKDEVQHNLYALTDKIVFEHEFPRIERVYLEDKDRVADMVARAMKDVTGLEGPWSIDVMMDWSTGTFYLIDMAIAEMSAY